MNVTTFDASYEEMTTSVRTREETTTTSLTKDEGFTRSASPEERTSASTQTGTSASMASQRRITTPGTIKNGLPSLMTTQLPSSTIGQNADILHQGLVAIAGNSFSLHCSSPVTTMFHWRYCSLRSRKLEIVFSGRRINERFHLAQSISLSHCDDRRCALNVRGLKLDDAGFFACMRRHTKYWSITLLGK